MARFLLALVVIACVVLGLGFYLGWFQFGVDRGKVDADLAKAKEQTKDLGRKARNAADRATEGAKVLTETQTAKGQVKQVDPPEHRIVVETTDHKDLTLYTDAGSKVERNGQAVGPDGLRAGDPVTVAYQVKDGKNFVTRVTVGTP
jgi:hypothetical protein